jgi:hypothetical protein
MCFVRKVCRFAMKGLPLGLPEATSSFAECSTGVDERATSYYAYAIVRPVSSQKRTIDPKVGRIVTRVGREKSVSPPKIRKTPRNFVLFLTAKVCFLFAITAKLSDNVCPTARRCGILAVGAAML